MNDMCFLVQLVLLVGVFNLVFTRTLPTSFTVNEVSLDNKLTPKRAPNAVSPVLDNVFKDSTLTNGLIPYHHILSNSSPRLSRISGKANSAFHIIPSGLLTTSENSVHIPDTNIQNEAKVNSGYIDKYAGSTKPETTIGSDIKTSQRFNSKTQTLPATDVPTETEGNNTITDFQSHGAVPSSGLSPSGVHPGRHGKTTPQPNVSGMGDVSDIKESLIPDAVSANIKQIVRVRKKEVVKALSSATDPQVVDILQDNAVSAMQFPRKPSLLTILSKALSAINSKKSGGGALISSNDIDRWYRAHGIKRVKSRSVSERATSEDSTTTADTSTTYTTTTETVTTTTDVDSTTSSTSTDSASDSSATTTTAETSTTTTTVTQSSTATSTTTSPTTNTTPDLTTTVTTTASTTTTSTTTTTTSTPTTTTATTLTTTTPTTTTPTTTTTTTTTTTNICDSLCGIGQCPPSCKGRYDSWSR